MTTQKRKEEILVPIRKEISKGKFRWHIEKRSAEDVFYVGTTMVAVVYKDDIPHIFDYSSGTLISEPHHFGMYFDSRMLPDDPDNPTYKVIKNPTKHNLLDYRGFVKFISMFEGESRMRLNALTWPRLNGYINSTPLMVCSALNAGEANPESNDLVWLLSAHKSSVFAPAIDSNVKALEKIGIRDIYKDATINHLSNGIVRQILFPWQHRELYYKIFFGKNKESLRVRGDIEDNVVSEEPTRKKELILTKEQADALKGKSWPEYTAFLEQYQKECPTQTVYVSNRVEYLSKLREL